MKKEYICPSIEVVSADVQELLTLGSTYDVPIFSDSEGTDDTEPEE